MHWIKMYALKKLQKAFSFSIITFSFDLPGYYASLWLVEKNQQNIFMRLLNSN